VCLHLQGTTKMLNILFAKGFKTALQKIHRQLYIIPYTYTWDTPEDDPHWVNKTNLPMQELGGWSGGRTYIRSGQLWYWANTNTKVLGIGNPALGGCHSHRFYSHGGQNFDQLFLGIWPLTTLIFGALAVDCVEFQPLTVDYELTFT